jgi:hypothetical protein
MATGRMEGSLQIVPMLPEHADEVLAIYQAGIDEGNASFETAAPTWETFDAEKLHEHRLVALDDSDGRVLGWVAVAQREVIDAGHVRRRTGRRAGQAGDQPQQRAAVHRDTQRGGQPHPGPLRQLERDLGQ